MDRAIVLSNLRAHANTIWDIFCTIYPTLANNAMPEIKLNNRFTVTAGICHVGYNTIEIGYKFMEKHSEEIFNIVLPHEIAHQIDFNLNGYPKNNRWHGTTWKNIMISFGLEPRTYHNMEL